MGSEVGVWDNMDCMAFAAAFAMFWSAVGVFWVPGLVATIIGKRNWWLMIGIDALVWIPAWFLTWWKGLWHIEILVLLGIAATVAGLCHMVERDNLRKVIIGSLFLTLMTTGVFYESMRLQDIWYAEAHDSMVTTGPMTRQIWPAIERYYYDHESMPRQSQWKNVVLADEFKDTTRFTADEVDRMKKDDMERLGRYIYTGASIQSDKPKPLIYRYISESQLGIIPDRTLVLYTDGKTKVVYGYQKYKQEPDKGPQKPLTN